MFSKVILVMCIIATICDSKFLDNITKCSKDDTACQTILMQNFFDKFCEGDVNEVGLKAIEPYSIKNMKVVVTDLFEILLIDGKIGGFKTCVINNFDLSLDNKRSVLDITCKRIILTSEYTIHSLRKILDANMTGHGNAEMLLEGAHMKIAYYYELERRNGDIYLKNKHKKPELLSFKVKNMHIDADNILLDKVEASETVLQLINSDPQLAMEPFRKVIGNKVIEIASQYVGKIIHLFPAKHFITDDLSSFVKN